MIPALMWVLTFMAFSFHFVWVANRSSTEHIALEGHIAQKVDDLFSGWAKRPAILRRACYFS